jgi:hypothetical protein
MRNICTLIVVGVIVGGTDVEAAAATVAVGDTAVGAGAAGVAVAVGRTPVDSEGALQASASPRIKPTIDSRAIVGNGLRVIFFLVFLEKPDRKSNEGSIFHFQ